MSYLRNQIVDEFQDIDEDGDAISTRDEFLAKTIQQAKCVKKCKK